MAKADLKTKKNEASVTDFLNQIEDPDIRADSLEVHEMMEKKSPENRRKCGA